ncbi:DALR anticodon-binding domain-containing protein [Dermatophilaceae bacterium Soc4.6]
MTPDELARVVWSAVAPATPPPPEGRPRVVPAADGPGWRSPLALRLAPGLARSSSALAQEAAARLAVHPDVGVVRVLGEGVLDVVLTPAAAGTVVARVLSAGGGAAPPAQSLATPGLPGPGRRRRDEPVFALVWAHSRARTVVALAAAQGIGPAEVGDLLTDPAETALLTALAASADDVARAIRADDGLWLLRRLAELAGRTHDWLDPETVVPRRVDDPVGPVHQARVALALATALVLGAGIDLLGLPRPVPV